MILLVTRSLIRWLSNSLLKFSIYTHSTIYFGKTLVELSGTMKWNEMKKLNILTLFSHLLLSQQIVKCTLLSAILPFSTNVVVKYQLMVAAKMIKKYILRKGKHTKYSAKKMCHRLSLSQFLIFSFSTLTFLLYIDIIPSMYISTWLIDFTSISSSASALNQCLV